MKNIRFFLSETFQFLLVKNSVYMYLNRHVLVMRMLNKGPDDMNLCILRMFEGTFFD